LFLFCVLYKYKSKRQGGGIVNYLTVIEKLFDEHDGILLTNDFINAGVSKQLLGKYVKKGYLRRIAHGVYASNDALEDEMFIIQVRSQKLVFSHETALYLHGLTDRDPLSYTVTIPSGYNATKLKDAGLDVYYISSNLLELGIEQGETIYGRNINVYDKERTICDVIRNKNTIDAAILNEGIKRYLLLKEKNIPKLIKYSKELRVEKSVRNYLEVLL
jgi:predicted transcriptional regulator of viral defense system